MAVPCTMSAMAAKPLAAAAIAQLESDGVASLIGTVVNPAGLIHAKTVPIRRMGAFADPGLGASPVWHVFAIDQAGIVVGDAVGVVGDQRIRVDLGRVAHPRRRTGLGAGVVLQPGRFARSLLQQGHAGAASRSAWRRRVSHALVGHEMEFVLVGPDGARLPSHLWAQYGLAGVLEYEGFVKDVTEAATDRGRRDRTAAPRVRRRTSSRSRSAPAVTRRGRRPAGG